MLQELAEEHKDLVHRFHRVCLFSRAGCVPSSSLKLGEK